MDRTLIDIFEQEGASTRISGNTLVLLSGAERVWCVLSGSVEVFATRVENGRVTGLKTHFFSAGPGDLLFGMDFEAIGLGQGFQAVGYPGTILAELDLDRFKELAAQESRAGALAAALERWVTGLSRGLTQDIIPRPLNELPLQSGQKLTVEADRVAGPAEGVVWVRYLEKSGLFISAEEVGPAQADRQSLLPLSERSWLLLFKGSAIETESTGQVLASGLVWPSLDRLYELTFLCLFLNVGLQAVDVYGQLIDKMDQDRRAGQDSLTRLASVLPNRALGPEPGQVFEDELLTACDVVARSLGLRVRERVSGAKQTRDKPLSVTEIAQASQFNARRVSLPERWWRQDQGPMVGFRVENRAPVALLPVSARAYELVEPATGQRRKVTAELAGELAAEAYTFYRPLPEGTDSGRKLFKFAFTGSGRDIKSVLIMSTLIGLLALVVPLATNFVFSEIIPSSERSRVWSVLVVLVGFGVSSALFEITRNMALLRTENRLHFFLESALWIRILRLPAAFFKKYEAGDLAMRAMGLGLVRQLVSGPVITALIGAVFSSFNIALLFYYDPGLALVAVGLLALAGVVVIGLEWVQLHHFREATKIEGVISGKVLQFLNAIPKIRVSGAEDQAFAIWAGDFSRQKKLAHRSGAAENMLQIFNGGFGLLSLMCLFSWLVFMDHSGLSTGQFLAFNAAYAALTAALLQLIIALNTLTMAVPHLERLKPILEEKPESDLVKTDPGRLSGKIDLYHLVFKYNPEGRDIIRDVSLSVEPGSFVALVGPSGSGKSTLMRLLLGFETPDSGTIYYDDQDLADLDAPLVRRNMGVVIQGGNVMAGTVFNNIIGGTDLGLEEAWQAAALAGLDEDIKRLPMGMHTVLMEGATTLSGGQRQRLMIARAIVSRPRIILFDEATSALDNQAQAVVSRSLEKLEATRIVVAHRLSTVKQADRIYVLDQGRIVQDGTYQELMAEDGLFRRMAERQLI